MPNSTLFRTLLTVICSVCILTLVCAQSPQKFDTSRPLIDRVCNTPDEVLQRFYEAGMSPSRHRLTNEEIALITAAFKALPPAHQEILKIHLDGISFLDNMPNTALTSTINTGDSSRRYHITFRAAILHQKLSDWLAEKERNCYSQDSSRVTVSFNTGDINAITYVLLHESTHVLDGSLGIFENVHKGFAARFNKGVWTGRTTIAPALHDSLLSKNCFRQGGHAYGLSQAPSVYRALRLTPFVSLYSTGSWSEDLAECLSVYHLTRLFKAPFRILVSDHGKTVLSYEPAKNKIVRERMKQLSIFYEKSINISANS